jgi:hypothetical protein
MLPVIAFASVYWDDARIVLRGEIATRGHGAWIRGTIACLEQQSVR